MEFFNSDVNPGISSDESSYFGLHCGNESNRELKSRSSSLSAFRDSHRQLGDNIHSLDLDVHSAISSYHRENQNSGNWVEVLDLTPHRSRNASSEHIYNLISARSRGLTPCPDPENSGIINIDILEEANDPMMQLIEAKFQSLEKPDFFPEISDEFPDGTRMRQDSDATLKLVNRMRRSDQLRASREAEVLDNLDRLRDDMQNVKQLYSTVEQAQMQMIDDQNKLLALFSQFQQNQYNYHP